MNPLQYTSKEMFSSTELIRKSKMVFDKLHNQEIEKAIILRDGKPSFMLLDFAMYEEIMKEYLILKSKENSNSNENKKTVIPQEIKPAETDSIDKLNEKDLEEALAQIDELNLENGEKEPLKEFWE